MTTKKQKFEPLTEEEQRQLARRLRNIEGEIVAIREAISGRDIESGPGGECRAKNETPASFAAFLDQRCTCAPYLQSASIALYRAYKGWVEDHGETPLSHKAFAALLSMRGFRKFRTRIGSIYDEIGLRAADHDDTPRQEVQQQSEFDHTSDGEDVQ